MVERWSAMWEVEGSSLDQTNTWDPQTSEENVLPLLWRLQVVDILVLINESCRFHLLLPVCSGWKGTCERTHAVLTD